MRKSVKVAVASVCVIVALPILFIPPYFPLPEEELGSCAVNSVTGAMTCSADHESLSFMLLGYGLLSSNNGFVTTYSWCNNLSGMGYLCPNGWHTTYW